MQVMSKYNSVQQASVQQRATDIKGGSVVEWSRALDLKSGGSLVQILPPTTI